MKMFIVITGMLLAAGGVILFVANLGASTGPGPGEAVGIVAAGLVLVCLGEIMGSLKALEFSLAEELREVQLKTPAGNQVTVGIRKRKGQWYPEVQGLDIPGAWPTADGALQGIRDHWKRTQAENAPRS